MYFSGHLCFPVLFCCVQYSARFQNEYVPIAPYKDGSICVCLLQMRKCKAISLTLGWGHLSDNSVGAVLRLCRF